MRRRLRALTGDDARGVAVHTYHGLAMRLTGRSFAPFGGPAGRDFREPDFDRLIPEAVKLLNDPEDYPGLPGDELRERLLSPFSHILVDEYQDVDRQQYDLVSALAGRAASGRAASGRAGADGERKLAIMAVGDDDQNIYAWSGADVEFIRRFREDYGAEVHYLVENYRSTAHVIAAANQLIAHNGDRLKREAPITVDASRRDHHPGGRWAAIEPSNAGRVRIVEVEDAATEAAALAERLVEMRRLDPELDFRDCAVLARRHSVLEPIRAVLEERGIPISWAVDRGSLPPAWRVREVSRFLQALGEEKKELRRASELEAARRRLAGDDLGNPWWRLVEEVLAEWQEETADARVSVDAAIEYAYEALAERRREPSFGEGVRLLTVHAAKGLEFRHVFMPGGFGWCPPEKLQEERRLYYVGMTRARETLTAFDRRDEQNPHVVVLGGEPVERTKALVERPPAPVVGRRYHLLGLSDVHLGFAGWRAAPDPMHRRLADLRPGSTIVPRWMNDGVDLLDASEEVVASLSKEGARTWGERLGEIESARVVAMIERRADDSEEPYRSRYLVERWEVPLVEVISAPGRSALVGDSR